MAVVQVSQAPSRGQYERVARIVNLDGARPEGLVLHIATDLPTGEVQIIDVYETAEQLAAVGEQRVMPAFAQAGVLEQVMAGPRPVAHEAFAIVR
jgi:hypothetical protein